MLHGPHACLAVFTYTLSAMATVIDRWVKRLS
jgi:hypothetical protein